ncbi:MAG: hypothetical protein MZV70_70015 [Desulfobacterales bacterium]|nr:hypothetical protein [Desulfobacterales bacterium]
MDKNAQLDKKSGYYSLYLNKFEDTLKLLSLKWKKLLIQKQTKGLSLRKPHGNWFWLLMYRLWAMFLLSLRWENPDVEDIDPLEEVQYFSHALNGEGIKVQIIPLDTALTALAALFNPLLFYRHQGSLTGESLFMRNFQSLKNL